MAEQEKSSGSLMDEELVRLKQELGSVNNANEYHKRVIKDNEAEIDRLHRVMKCTLEDAERDRLAMVRALDERDRVKKENIQLTEKVKSLSVRLGLQVDANLEKNEVIEDYKKAGQSLLLVAREEIKNLKDRYATLQNDYDRLLQIVMDGV